MVDRKMGTGVKNGCFTLDVCDLYMDKHDPFRGVYGYGLLHDGG